MRGAWVLILLLAACGFRVEGAPVALPVLEAAGPPVEELEELVVTLEIRADGTLRLDGQELGTEDLRPALLVVAERSREPGGDSLSRVALSIRADRGLDFARVEDALRVAADPEARMNRVYFAVRGAASGAEGSLRAFLPISFGRSGGRRIRVRLSATGAPVTAGALGRYFLRHMEENDEVEWEAVIASEAGVPTGFALAALDAAQRTGMAAAFGAAPLDRPSPEGPAPAEDRFAILVDGWGIDEDGNLRPAGTEFELTSLAERLTGLDRPEGELPAASLAVLAFLETGTTHKHGWRRQRSLVKETLQLLKRAQQPDGLVGAPDAPPDLRVHALGTLAMAETYRRTASPLFKQCSQSALDRLAKFGADTDPAADWAAVAFLSGSDAGLRVPAERLTWAKDRLGNAPAEPPETTDPFDWAPGWIRARRAGGDAAARWRRALESDLLPAPAPVGAEGAALRLFLLLSRGS